jgi:uncharacterized membrane protein YqaE (UPF0057 family)
MKKNLLLIAFMLFISGQAMSAFVSSSTTKAEETVVNPTEVKTTPAAADVKAAMEQFKNLSKAEKRSKIKEVKKQLRELKAEKKAGAEPSTNTLLLVILALLLPPLAVYLHQGEINGTFWLNLILTLLFFIPGVIHALIVVLGK